MSFRIHFRFDVKVAEAVAKETGLPFVTAENKFEALVREGEAGDRERERGGEK